ncbi:MAG TPA: hypothetical protein VGD07_12595 [Methylomirabilota bacterium]
MVLPGQQVLGRREMLSLNILWSSAATPAFAWTALTTGPRVGGTLVAIRMRHEA